MKSIRIIYLYFLNSLQQHLANPPSLAIFFVAKVSRYGLFMIFIYLLVGQVAQIQGYTKEQMLFFYLTFNIIETIAQLLFREVYRFLNLIATGNFDMVLVKPFSPLLRALVGGPDFIDLGVLVILLIITAYIVSFINPTPLSLFFYSLLIFNSLLLATAFHICVLAIGVINVHVDHLILIYRDITNLMRIPVDLYSEPFRSFLTFAVPLGVMFTFPAKMLFGLLSWQLVVISFALGIVYLFLSLKFWNYALKQYSSASS